MKSGDKSKSKTKYGSGFKRQAVEHYLSSGRTQSEVALNLGVSVSALSRWINEYRKDRDSGVLENGVSEEVRQELLKLQEEVRVARMERDILKEAIRFFANESQKNTFR